MGGNKREGRGWKARGCKVRKVTWKGARDAKEERDEEVNGNSREGRGWKGKKWQVCRGRKTLAKEGKGMSREGWTGIKIKGGYCARRERDGNIQGDRREGGDERRGDAKGREGAWDDRKEGEEREGGGAAEGGRFGKGREGDTIEGMNRNEEERKK
jgi:hypothetical protein